ncbi:MAG: PulJ/GspJ family protein [Chloroflexota bacterium]
MVGLGISVAIGTVAVGSLFQLFKAEDRSGAHLEAATQSRTVTRWLFRDVRQAEGTTLEDGVRVDSASFEWTKDDGTSEACQYSLTGTALKRECDSGTVTIGRSVQAIQFQRAGNLVHIDLTVSGNGNPPVEQGLNLTVLMRGM